MALENLTYLLPEELVPHIKVLIYVLNALGGFIIFYIIFNVINAVLSHKKKFEIEKISSMVEEIRNYLAYDYQLKMQQYYQKQNKNSNQGPSFSNQP